MKYMSSIMLIVMISCCTKESEVIDVVDTPVSNAPIKPDSTVTIELPPVIDMIQVEPVLIEEPSESEVKEEFKVLPQPVNDADTTTTILLY